jgi:putative sterol carrier protein
MTAKDFILGLPEKVNADAVEGMSTTFHFDVEGDGGGQYTVQLVDGKMTATEGIEGTAVCSVKTKSETFVALVTGQQNPMTAFMMGKIKVSNPGELLKYSKIFGLM